MTHVDLLFPARGNLLARDHGYALYGALSRTIPELHGADWLAVHGINATLLGASTLSLRSRARLRVRVPVERIGTMLGLAGKQIDVGGNSVMLGAPSVHPLVPAPTLDARLVVIKLTGGLKSRAERFDAEAFVSRFRAEASRQLGELGIGSEVAVRGRSSITVAGRRIVGCAVRVSGLSSAHSFELQVRGIGGKHTMGCGVFRPAKVQM